MTSDRYLPLKRKREQPVEDTREAGHQASPPQKRLQPTRPKPTPAEFWDNLSEVPLCKRALRELDRRSVQRIVSKPLAQPIQTRQRTEEIKRFARCGGPDIRDLRGYPAQPTRTMRSSRTGSSQSGSNRVRHGTESSSASSQTKASSCTSRDPAFQMALTDCGIHGIYNKRKGPPPGNLGEIRARLAEPRPSLSPSRFSEGQFEHFQEKSTQAGSEAMVRNTVFPVITGDGDVLSGREYQFNKVAPLAPGLSNPRPDFYDGAMPSSIDRRVRDDLHQYIVPCTELSRPALPNHFTELKGPNGNALEMQLQITQDLAIGARGMLHMRSYLRESYDLDGKAYAFGSTYHSGTGTLQIYSMHPIHGESPGEQTQYQATQLRSFSMTDNAETFREGGTWHRNSRDLARDERDDVIAYANRVARTGGLGTSCELHSQETTLSHANSDDTVQNDTDTSLDELATDRNQLGKRPKSRRSGARKRPSTGSSTSQGTASDR